MKFAAYLMTGALLVLAGAVTFAIVRGEDTRADLRVVKRERTVDPCAKPQSKSCQRRIRLVLRELAERHPGALRDLGVEPERLTELTEGSVSGGGGAGTSPVGGGPIGRVPSPGSPPSHDDPAPPAPSEPSPLIDLDAPLPTQVCVDDVLGVNC